MTNPNDSAGFSLEGTYGYGDTVVLDFPNGRIDLPISKGLTKREYFAAMAMQGIASNNEVSDTENWVWLAKASVFAADALINVLNQDNESTTSKQ